MTKYHRLVRIDYQVRSTAFAAVFAFAFGVPAWGLGAGSGECRNRAPVRG